MSLRLIHQSGGGAFAAVKGSARFLANAAGVEPSPSDRLSTPIQSGAQPVAFPARSEGQLPCSVPEAGPLVPYPWQTRAGSWRRV